MRAASTAFSSSLTGVLYFLASRPSCCAYWSGVRPARRMTTSSVNSGGGLESFLSAAAPPGSSTSRSTSSSESWSSLERSPIGNERSRLLPRPWRCNVWLEVLDATTDFFELGLIDRGEPALGVRLFERLHTALTQRIHERLDQRLRRLAVASVELMPRTLKR